MPSAPHIYYDQQSLLYHGSGEKNRYWLTSQFPYARNFFIILSPEVVFSLTKNLSKNHINSKMRYGCYRWSQRYLSSGDTCSSCNRFAYSARKEDYVVIYKPKWVLSHPNSVLEVTGISGMIFISSLQRFTKYWNLYQSMIAPIG